MSEVFVSTDARHACPRPRGVIGSTMGAYPRSTGSNPVEGNGHFFPSCRQLYLSSFSDTHSVRACRGGYFEMFNFLAGISEYSTVSVISIFTALLYSLYWPWDPLSSLESTPVLI